MQIASLQSPKSTWQGTLGGALHVFDQLHGLPIYRTAEPQVRTTPTK